MWLPIKNQGFIKTDSFSHLVEVLQSWEPTLSNEFELKKDLLAVMLSLLPEVIILRGISEYYFSKFLDIIRRNRTSAAVLDGNETVEQLKALADDVSVFWPWLQECNQDYLPSEYDFVRCWKHLKNHYIFVL